MADSKLVVGALDFLGYGQEAVKGTPVAAINDFLFVTSNNINAEPDVIRKNVMAGDRFAERTIRTSKFKIHGSVMHPLYPNSGAQFALAALGMDTYLSSVVGAYTVGSTTGGVTTFTSATVGVVPGAWSTFGTGATQDIRQVLPGGSPNVWKCAALQTANQGAAGAFTQLAQHKFSPILRTDPLVNTLPTLTLEMNEGGQYAWQLAGCYNSKYNVKGGKEDVEISENIIGTVMPVKIPFGSFTQFSPTTEELRDVARPFTINDGFVMVPNDYLAGGTSVVQPLLSLEDWEFDYDNGILQKAFWDGGQVYKAYPGLGKTGVKWKYAIPAGRPDAYEDYLQQLNQQPFPFTASMALNLGTPSSPSWNAYGIYVPSLVMTKATIGRSVNDLQTLNVEADALITQAGTDIADIFVINSTVAAYVGS